ncbi:hypothetical protein F5X99DRAFT_429071 [Biscogniauxia marginata]|nr:hypothetical protein F5X99DRAFT_429071 [Biscogniauxia marginata]
MEHLSGREREAEGREFRLHASPPTKRLNARLRASVITRLLRTPAFLRQTKDHRVGAILSIFHKIPSVRNILLSCGRPSRNYGHNSEWWKGQPIFKQEHLAAMARGEQLWDEEAHEELELEMMLSTECYHHHYEPPFEPFGPRWGGDPGCGLPPYSTGSSTSSGYCAGSIVLVATVSWTWASGPAGAPQAPTRGSLLAPPPWTFRQRSGGTSSQRVRRRLNTTISLSAPSTAADVALGEEACGT